MVTKRHRERDKGTNEKGRKEEFAEKKELMQFQPPLGRSAGTAQALLTPAEEIAAIHFRENVAPSMEF